MSDKLRVAAVGAGYFSRFQYEAWNRIEAVELVATANRTITSAQEIAETFQVPQVFENVPEMLDATSPDVLDIITPPETHLAAITAAAERGIDVICQKPFCSTLEAAQQATAIAKSAGIKLIIHENFRYQPWHRQIKSMLDRGDIGDPYQIVFRLRPGDGQGPEAYLERQPYFQKMERFLVHETAIHLIDTFRFLMGEMTNVYADLRRVNPVIAGEDAGVIIFQFANGTRGVFDGNRLSDHKAENRRLTMGEMIVEGSGGVIQLSGDGTITRRPHGSNEAEVIAYDWRDHAFGGDCVYLLQAASIEAIKGQRPLENTGEDYLRNIEIENAIYQSSADGRRIDL
ncbi:MAG: Gfo/Idh/MocA family oxidoreductase [Pseudomonadota bacterium]